MEIRVFESAETVATQAAQIVAREARSAVAARGKFVMAVSGGSTPWQMLRALANEQMPWNAVEIVQVDERVAPEGDADRNLTHLRESLLSHAPLRPEQIHAMPVNDADLNAAAAGYAKELQAIAGIPAVLDLVHLGLGPDGHTASLVPKDAVLDETSTDVALAGIYQGRRRMTLTYPIINRARRILWLITGEGKQTMLARLINRDAAIPAGRVNQDHAIVLADRAAAAQLNSDGITKSSA